MAIDAKKRGFLFDEVKITQPDYSAFDMSFENKLSSNMGLLVPTLCKEILPGDYFELQSSSLVRFAPTLAPILHNVDVCTYTFFVPNRLIWNEWEKFISPGNGSVTMVNQPSFVPPITPYTTFGDLISFYGESNIPGTLADYLGVPDVNVSTETGRFSILPFRAYQLCWNEYFRDQNIERDIFNTSNGSTVDDGIISKDSGYLDSSISPSQFFELFTIRRKSWEKDYFTAALPTPQRGAQVILPLGTDAPLSYTGPANKYIRVGGTALADTNYPIEGLSTAPPSSNSNVFIRPDGKAAYSVGSTQAQPVAISSDLAVEASSNETLQNLITQNFKVDLSSASSATVETLRNAFKLQEFLEKSARSGARYIENILAHFGVESSDARLDRPELLGTHREPVVVSPVEQNSSVPDENSPTGTLFGKLTSSYQCDTISYKAEEHGFLIQLQCVLPRTSYQQGLSRMYTRETYLDYAWPEFAHLGEQEVYNRELYNGFRPYFSGDGIANSVTETWRNGVFGYQPRYAEYKYNPDEVHGDFKGSLRFWHLSRLFRTAPTLSPTFIHCDPRNDIFAVTDPSVHHLYQEIWHDFKMVRALPEYGTPHF